MAEYRIEITDSAGTTMKVLVRVPVDGKPTWETLTKGQFTVEGGVADVGHKPPDTTKQWLCLYRGDVVDDLKLVLHLDAFRGLLWTNTTGTGTIYPRDHVGMKQGALTWRIEGS